MCGNKFRICDLPEKLLTLRKRLFLGITSIVLIVTVFAFASFSQASQGKDLSLRSALKSSWGEFYEMGDPISLFYFERNYEPFWIENRERLESLSRSLSEAGSHGLPQSRYPLGELKEAIFEDDPTQKAKLELMATEAFLLFQDISGGILKPNMIDANINVDPQRRKASDLLASLTESFDVSSFFENLFPRSNEYRYLVDELRRMRNIVSDGSWGDPVPSGTTLQLGMTHEHVPFLRKRLSKMGYPVSQTNLRIFDEQLDASVKKFQEYHGLNPDGVFGKRSIEAINVPPKARLVQILVNLERMRWNNQDRGIEYVSVNQANFYAYFKSGNKKVWESRVVIGLPSNQTANSRYHNPYGRQSNLACA